MQGKMNTVEVLVIVGALFLSFWGGLHLERFIGRWAFIPAMFFGTILFIAVFVGGIRQVVDDIRTKRRHRER